MQLLSAKLSWEFATIYPLMTYSQQEMSKSRFKVCLSCYSRILEGWFWRGTEGCTSWFGCVVHFSATWQISLASVRAQLGPRTLNGDLMSLLTLTAQPDRPRGYASPSDSLSHRGSCCCISSQCILGVDGCVFTDPLTLFQSWKKTPQGSSLISI